MTAPRQSWWHFDQLPQEIREVISAADFTIDDINMYEKWQQFSAAGATASQVADALRRFFQMEKMKRDAVIDAAVRRRDT